PGCMLLTCGILKIDRNAKYIAAVLSLVVGPFWYRWGLSYGTLPFLLSISSASICAALCYRFCDEEMEFSSWHAAALIPAVSFSIFWTPGALIVAPLLLFTLCKSIKRPYRMRMIVPLCLLAII